MKVQGREGKGGGRNGERKGVRKGGKEGNPLCSCTCVYY